MSATATLLLAAATLITAPLLGFLAASRKLSGKIATSDADRLWDASESMRKEYREDLAAANRRIVALEERVAHLEALNNDLIREKLALEDRIAVLLKGA